MTKTQTRVNFIFWQILARLTWATFPISEKILKSSQVNFLAIFEILSRLTMGSFRILKAFQNLVKSIF